MNESKTEDSPEIISTDPYHPRVGWFVYMRPYDRRRYAIETVHRGVIKSVRPHDDPDSVLTVVEFDDVPEGVSDYQDFYPEEFRACMTHMCKPRDSA